MARRSLVLLLVAAAERKRRNNFWKLPPRPVQEAKLLCCSGKVHKIEVEAYGKRRHPHNCLLHLFARGGLFGCTRVKERRAVAGAVSCPFTPPPPGRINRSKTRFGVVYLPAARRVRRLLLESMSSKGRNRKRRDRTTVVARITSFLVWKSGSCILV